VPHSSCYTACSVGCAQLCGSQNSSFDTLWKLTVLKSSDYGSQATRHDDNDQPSVQHEHSKLFTVKPLLYFILIFVFVSCIFLKKNVAILAPYLLTPWSRVLLEKLTGLQPVKFPTFNGNRRFITALKSARHLSLS